MRRRWGWQVRKITRGAGAAYQLTSRLAFVLYFVRSLFFFANTIAGEPNAAVSPKVRETPSALSKNFRLPTAR